MMSPTPWPCHQLGLKGPKGAGPTSQPSAEAVGGTHNPVVSGWASLRRHPPPGHPGSKSSLTTVQLGGAALLLLQVVPQSSPWSATQQGVLNRPRADSDLKRNPLAVPVSPLGPRPSTGTG